MRKQQGEIKYIVVHNSGGTDANPMADTSHHTYEIVNEWHRQRWNYPASNGTFCGYHYFISKTGIITPATPENEEGMHTIGQNLNSIGICLAGNFDATLPTTAQEVALRGLLSSLVVKYGITPAQIYPHRQFSLKSCYGNKLASSWARNLLKEIPDEVLLTVPPKADIKSLQKQVITLGRKVVELLMILLRLKR